MKKPILNFIFNKQITLELNNQLRVEKRVWELRAGEGGGSNKTLNLNLETILTFKSVEEMI